jgi:hypothetical protein
MSKVNLNDTMDASVWTYKWMETIKEHPEIPQDWETMIAWFANAIMAGYDQGRKAGEDHGGENLSA